MWWSWDPGGPVNKRPLKGSRVSDKSRKWCESQLLTSRLVARYCGERQGEIWSLFRWPLIDKGPVGSIYTGIWNGLPGSRGPGVRFVQVFSWAEQDLTTSHSVSQSKGWRQNVRTLPSIVTVVNGILGQNVWEGLGRGRFRRQRWNRLDGETKEKYQCHSV